MIRKSDREYPNVKILAYHEDMGGWPFWRDPSTKEDINCHPDYKSRNNACNLEKTWDDKNPSLYIVEMKDGAVLRVLNTVEK